MVNKVLVAYFTKGGASKEYAEVISKTLSENKFSVDTINLKEKIPDISSYDTIILGTGVRMFMVYRRWKKILKQKVLNDKNLFLFLSSGMAMEEPEKAVEKFLDPLVKKYDLKPVSLISFPGKFPDKWAENEEQKKSMKPELAIDWTQDIIQKIKI